MTSPQGDPASSETTNDAVPFETLFKPSSVIKCFDKTITVAETAYDMTLIIMQRSFIFIISNAETGGILGNIARSREPSLVESFMKQNQSLKGLSLAIGGHSTCLIDSENSVASLTLASRLSKALNNNGPVYVANNMEAPDKLEEIYHHIFKFVRSSFRGKKADALFTGTS